MRTHQAIVLSLIVLSGCTATQLRYETLNQAATVESITEKQIFFNLALFDQNPYALPSQVTVIAGSATTTDSASPTFMTPLGLATTTTSQLAAMTSSSMATAAVVTPQTVATAVSTGTSGTTTTTTNGTTGGSTTTNTSGTSGGPTNSVADTRPNRSLSLALSDSWMESWTLDPVVNPDVLRRLSALYRYVLGESDVVADASVGKNKRGYPDLLQFKAWVAKDPANKVAVDTQFICDYPLTQPPSAAGETAPTMSTKITTKTQQGAPKEVTTTGPDPNAGGTITLTLNCPIDSRGDTRPRSINVKASVLELPNCIVCLDDADRIAAIQKAEADRIAETQKADADNIAQTPKAIVSQVAPDAAAALADNPHALYVNPNLQFGFVTRTAVSVDGTQKPTNNIHLGHGFYGDLNSDPNPHRAFHQFELFVDTATIVQNAAGGTPGGSNQKLLSVPISPNGFLLK